MDMEWIYKSETYRAWRRFLTWFGDIYFATSLPKVRAEHIRKMLSLIQKGDILCRKYNYYLDSYFIKGKYSHSGVVVDGTQIVHAIAEGVEAADIIDFVKDTDGFIILRPLYKNVDDAVNFSISQIGKPYDFIFSDKDTNYFYCHELSWNALQAGGVSVTPKESVIYADDLIGACEKVYEV